MHRGLRFLLTVLVVSLVGCGADEDPETAALLDALRCPAVGSSSFYVDSTVPGLDPFDAKTAALTHGVLVSTSASTTRGDHVVIRDEIGLDPDGVELTVVDGGGEELHFCGGEGSVQRLRESASPLGPDAPDDVRVRVVLRSVRTGAACDTELSGDIQVCFTN